MAEVMMWRPRGAARARPMMPRLLASVPPEVNTTPAGCTPKASAIVVRADSRTFAARSPAECTLEGLAQAAS